MTKFEVLEGLQAYGGDDFTVTAVEASGPAFAELAKELGDRMRPLSVVAEDGEAREGIALYTTRGRVTVMGRRP